MLVMTAYLNGQFVRLISSDGVVYHVFKKTVEKSETLKVLFSGKDTENQRSPVLLYNLASAQVHKSIQALEVIEHMKPNQTYSPELLKLVEHCTEREIVSYIRAVDFLNLSQAVHTWSLYLAWRLCTARASKIKLIKPLLPFHLWDYVDLQTGAYRDHPQIERMSSLHSRKNKIYNKDKDNDLARKRWMLKKLY